VGKRYAVESRTSDNDAVREIAEGRKAIPPYEGTGRTGEDAHTHVNPQKPPQKKEINMADTTIINIEHNPVKYDVNALRTFLNVVFPTPRSEGEFIFTQLSKKAPRGFGAPPEALLVDRLDRSNAAMRGYMSTSTLSMTDDALRHTKAAFKRFCLLVLDDIGTKIPESRIPPELEYNYRIESSEGNFQLGFILAEPLTDYMEAQILIDLFVDAELTDGGGAMPCKKVRLPCGVNGKSGAGGDFHVRLVGTIDPRPWSVQELLDAAGIDVVWDKHRLKARDENVRARRIGTSAWNPDLFYMDPTNGVHDPVLEFMNTKGMVIQEAQTPFMDVICPFSDGHTDTSLEGRMCGYSPLGHGVYPHKRVFHCFHEHCKGKTNDDFLDHIHAMGGPLMPAKEFAPATMVNYVYDMPNDRVFDLAQKGSLIPLPIAAINRVTERVFIGKKSVDPLAIWLKQPSCLKVHGQTFDPTTRALIIEDDRGLRYVNTFSMPEYPDINPAPEKVAVFLDYLKYLLPAKVEHDYFLDWLTCKVKNPSFRGAAVVLISQAQGTGKNTLMDMLSRLFGQHNTAQVAMDDLINPKSAFNDWATKLFVNVNESLATDNPLGARRAYNKLKEIVDPKAMNVTINRKHQPEFQAKCATSFLFFSNHSDAVYLQHGDRRFFGAQGPDVPAPIAYFAKVHAWIRSDAWRAHVWNFLAAREVDESSMMAAPPVTAAMENVVHAATSPMEAVITGAIACWPCDLVSPNHIVDLLLQYTLRGVPDNYKPPARRILNDRLKSLRAYEADNVKFNRRVQKDGVRYALHARNPVVLTNADEVSCHRKVAADFIEKYDAVAFKSRIDNWLSDNGFEF
jgi:hypothetical protein